MVPFMLFTLATAVAAPYIALNILLVLIEAVSGETPRLLLATGILLPLEICTSPVVVDTFPATDCVNLSKTSVIVSETL